MKTPEVALQNTEAEAIAIIAGSGSLPKSIAKTLQKQGRRFIVVCLKGASRPQEYQNYTSYSLGMGELLKFFALMEEKKISQIVMAGNVVRPSLAMLKLDKLAREVVRNSLLNSAGDNDFLTNLIKVFEQHNLKVVAAHTIDSSLVSCRRNYSDVPIAISHETIKKGLDIVRKIGELDIGQAIVMRGNRVIAVEGADGTDAMLKRCEKILKVGIIKRIIRKIINPLPQSNMDVAVLFKTSKPNQDLRVDMASIGKKTVINCAKAGISGIVTEAGRSIILDADEMLPVANDNNVFVVALDTKEYDD